MTPETYNGVQVSTADLQIAQGHITTAGEELANLKNNIALAMDQTNAGWNTDAANTFRNVMGVWVGDFQKIINDLQQIADAMGLNKVNYTGTLDMEHAGANQVAALLNQDAHA